MSSDNLYQMDPTELYSWLADKYQYEYLTPETHRRLMRGVRRLAVLLDTTVDEVVEQLVADTMFAEAV